MSDISRLKATFEKIGIPVTIRRRGNFEYLFVGAGSDAKLLRNPDDDFDTTDLDSLLVRHHYFEFEFGKLVSWSAS